MFAILITLLITKSQRLSIKASAMVHNLWKSCGDGRQEPHDGPKYVFKKSQQKEAIRAPIVRLIEARTKARNLRAPPKENTRGTICMRCPWSKRRWAVWLIWMCEPSNDVSNNSRLRTIAYLWPLTLKTSRLSYAPCGLIIHSGTLWVFRFSETNRKQITIWSQKETNGSSSVGKSLMRWNPFFENHRWCPRKILRKWNTCTSSLTAVRKSKQQDEGVESVIARIDVSWSNSDYAMTQEMVSWRGSKTMMAPKKLLYATEPKRELVELFLGCLQQPSRFASLLFCLHAWTYVYSAAAILCQLLPAHPVHLRNQHSLDDFRESWEGGDCCGADPEVRQRVRCLLLKIRDDVPYSEKLDCETFAKGHLWIAHAFRYHK